MVRVELEGVPETALWTLYHRALEARRRDAVLEDPLAVDLVERLDHPFAERFGRSGLQAQWQALRARCFDGEVRRFLAGHPGATVVALGEGLETQFWRVDDGRVRWLTVDLPESVALRERLLPDSPRLEAVAGSALESGWMDAVDPAQPVLVTAQGLLMYFERADAHRLISAAAQRFPGGAMVFDTAPRWLAESTRRKALETPTGYRPPPWLWGIDAAEERALARLPGVGELRTLRLPRGRGPLQGWALPVLTRIEPLGRLGYSVLRAAFAPG